MMKEKRKPIFGAFRRHKGSPTRARAAAAGRATPDTRPRSGGRVPPLMFPRGKLAAACTGNPVPTTTTSTTQVRVRHYSPFETSELFRFSKERNAQKLGAFYVRWTQALPGSTGNDAWKSFVDEREGGAKRYLRTVVSARRDGHSRMMR